MQEEVEQRTLTLVINGTKFSGRVLKSAVSKFVAFCRNQKAKKVDGQKVQEVRIVYNFVGEIPEIAA